MEILKVIQVGEYADYILFDQKGKKYELCLNFIQYPKLQVGDYFIIDKNLIDQESEQFIGDYSWGLMEEQVDEEYIRQNSTRYAQVVRHGKTTQLQRLFG